MLREATKAVLSTIKHGIGNIWVELGRPNLTDYQLNKAKRLVESLLGESTEEKPVSLSDIVKGLESKFPWQKHPVDKNYNPINVTDSLGVTDYALQVLLEEGKVRIVSYENREPHYYLTTKPILP